MPWVAICLSLAFSAPSSASGVRSAEVAREIFAALGVEREIGRIASVAIARLEELEPVPGPDRVTLRQILTAGFAAPELERRAREAFRSRFDATRASVAAKWLARPEIQRLYAASQAGNTGCDDPRTASVERRRAMARILAATNVAARAHRHADEVLVALLQEANQAMPETHRYTRYELASLIAAHRAAQPAPRSGWACVYRNFSTAFLVDAQGFLESEAGVWLHSRVSAAVGQTLSEAARATALRIVDDLGEPDPRRAPWRVASQLPRP